MPRPAFLASASCPVVGMVHLPPLPGAPGYGGDFATIEARARADAEALLTGGVDAVLVENFHDAPFYPGPVPSETVAAMSAVARMLRETVRVPLGINVLRNDGCAALAVAVAAGAEFIRVNVLAGARLTDQGIVHGIAHDLLRARARLGGGSVAILADVDVKHSAPLADYPLAQEVADLLERAGADALVVSGSGTGQGVRLHDLHAVREAAGAAPVLVGSGVTAENAPRLATEADGLIIGTTFKDPDRPERIDPARVRRLVDALTPVRAAGITEDR